MFVYSLVFALVGTAAAGTTTVASPQAQQPYRLIQIKG